MQPKSTKENQFGIITPQYNNGQETTITNSENDMSVKFTLFKKKSPKTQSMQWYAAPKSSYPTADDTTPSESSRGAAISDIETEATLRQVGQYIPHELIKGNTVKVPGLGTFQLSFHSKGVDDIALFDAEDDQRHPRCVLARESPEEHAGHAAKPCQCRCEGGQCNLSLRDRLPDGHEQDSCRKHSVRQRPQ